MVEIRQSDCNRAKLALFGLKWLYLGKVVVFEENCLYSGKSGFNRAIRLFSVKNGCNCAKVVVFGQKWFYTGNKDVFGQKWLYSGKSCCNRAKVVLFGQNRF